MTSYGLGSRRLASFAVQQLASGSRAVAVVDELESGLEPHRAVRLLNYLLSDDAYSQVIVTTHSAVIVEQARLENLATVQNHDGVVVVTSLDDSGELMQRLRRSRPSSFLARRVLVSEGKTEHGMFLACLEEWDTQRAAVGLSTSAGEGVAVQDGMGGTEVCPRAQAFAQLGFEVAAFLDHDDTAVDSGVTSAQAAGVQVIRWGAGHNTETQICSQLQADMLNSFIALGSNRRNGTDTVLQDINNVDTTNPVLSLDVQVWLDSGMTIDAARNRVASAAVTRKWFKDVEGGRDLGNWLLTNYQNAQLISPVSCLDQVRSFLYPEVQTTEESGKGEPGDG